jgi:hypothetical protein
MFEDYLKDKVAERKFLITLHGHTLEKDDVKNDMSFRSPEDYKHLTHKERKELTQKMMGHWGVKLGIDQKEGVGSLAPGEVKK